MQVIRHFVIKGWDKYKTAAKLWKGIDIPIDEKTFCFTLIHEKIKNISEAFGEVLHVVLSLLHECSKSYRVFEQQSAAFSKYGHMQTTCETAGGNYGEIQEQNLVSFTR